MYELVSELIWRPEQFTKENWLEGYSRARYGSKNANAEKAWKMLGHNLQLPPGDTTAGHNGVDFLRPSIGKGLESIKLEPHETLLQAGGCDCRREKIRCCRSLL